jgi:hypothetical protein
VEKKNEKDVWLSNSHLSCLPTDELAFWFTKTCGVIPDLIQLIRSYGGTSDYVSFVTLMKQLDQWKLYGYWYDDCMTALQDVVKNGMELVGAPFPTPRTSKRKRQQVWEFDPGTISRYQPLSPCCDEVEGLEFSHYIPDRRPPFVEEQLQCASPLQVHFMEEDSNLFYFDFPLNGTFTIYHAHFDRDVWFREFYIPQRQLWQVRTKVEFHDEDLKEAQKLAAETLGDLEPGSPNEGSDEDENDDNDDQAEQEPEEEASVELDRQIDPQNIRDNENDSESYLAFHLARFVHLFPWKVVQWKKGADDISPAK